MASSYTAALNALGHMSFDWIIIIALIVLVAGESLRSGTNKAIALSLALPLGYVMYGFLQNAAFLQNSLAGEAANPTAQAVIFLGLLIVAFLLVYRCVSFYGASSGGMFGSAVVGISTVIILLVFWLQVPALSTLWKFGPQIQSVFAEAYRFWWLIGAYFVLAAFRS